MTIFNQKFIIDQNFIRFVKSEKNFPPLEKVLPNRIKEAYFMNISLYLQVIYYYY